VCRGPARGAGGLAARAIKSPSAVTVTLYTFKLNRKCGTFRLGVRVKIVCCGRHPGSDRLSVSAASGQLEGVG
jgi:hypothetical protein